MTDTIIVPTADDIIAPAITQLTTLRPNSAPYLAGRIGVYWHPVLGFRGQAAKMLERLADLAAARRLKSATGTDLLDYVASEFDTVPETDKTFAQGTITLGRGTDSDLTGGDYPKGTRITRNAYVSLGISIPAGEYETLADAHIDTGSTDTVAIPIQAVVAGTDANHPLLVNAPAALDQISVPSLVTNVVVVDFEVGGGSDGPPTAAGGAVLTPDPDFDNFVRQFAKAYSLGQYGPTEAASKLGALAATGVRHYAVFDVPETGTQMILVADKGWGSSTRWAGAVQQSIVDNDYIGFGCVVAVNRIRSRVVTAEVTVSLRDTDYLAETTDITVAIQAAVRSYFDDRPDWNTWNKDSLRAAISLAHPKVYQCSSAIVKDSATNLEIAEIPAPDYTVEQLHFFLASNAMKITYTGPS